MLKTGMLESINTVRLYRRWHKSVWNMLCWELLHFVLLCCRYLASAWAKLTWGAGLAGVMYQEPVSLAPEGGPVLCAYTVNFVLLHWCTPLGLVTHTGIYTGVRIYTQNGTLCTKQQQGQTWQTHTLCMELFTLLLLSVSGNFQWKHPHLFLSCIIVLCS